MTNTRLIYRAWIVVEHFGGRRNRFEKSFIDKADACRWIINCLPQARDYATAKSDRIKSGIAEDCQQLQFSMVYYTTTDSWYPKGTRVGDIGWYTTEKSARKANEEKASRWCNFDYPTESVLETKWKTISRGC